MKVNKNATGMIQYRHLAAGDPFVLPADELEGPIYGMKLSQAAEQFLNAVVLRNGELFHVDLNDQVAPLNGEFVQLGTPRDKDTDDSVPPGTRERWLKPDFVLVYSQVIGGPVETQMEYLVDGLIFASYRNPMAQPSKVNVIKYVRSRSATDVGLKEAKDFVDANWTQLTAWAEQVRIL